MATGAHDPMETLWFRVCHDAVFLSYHMAMTLGFSLRLSGQRNLPRSGPSLLVANHQSFLDPPLIGLAAGRPLVYLARKTLFRNRYFGAMIGSMRAIPIDQDGVGKDGIRAILEQLHLGKTVVVFPEGSRTPDGTMQPLKGGIHLLIRRTQAPIIPVGIAGAYDAWPMWRAYPLPAPLFLPARPGTIAVVIGKPLDARRYADMPRAQAMQELFDKIQAVQRTAEKRRRH